MEKKDSKARCAVMKYLDDTNSTWCPEEAIHTDISEDIESGALIRRQYGRFFYLTTPFYEKVEKAIAQRFYTMAAKTYDIDEEKVKGIIERFEKEKSEILGSPFKLNDQQKEAVFTFCKNHVAILIGGPGTGKTSVLQCVDMVLGELYHNPFIVYTAPTGKAALRLSESTGKKAQTHQSYIDGWNKKYVSPKAPFAFFGDESSMVDMKDLNYIVKGLKQSTRIYLIGDPEQLQSVGKGKILADLIECTDISLVELTQPYRQDESSSLFDNIQLIREGCNVPLRDGSDFKNIRTEKNILENTINEYLSAVKEYGLDNTIILTPYKKQGIICSEKLNNTIQNILNPEEKGVPFIRKRIPRDSNRWIWITFRIDDPVIQLENTSKVANGEIGKIVSIHGDTLTVQYPTGLVNYTEGMLKQLDLAYAISVHKSQGSEYSCVIFPAMKEHRNLDRTMVYTAVSRAKKYCVVIGEDSTIQDACKTVGGDSRTTFIREEFDIIKLTMKLIEEFIFKN